MSNVDTSQIETEMGRTLTDDEAARADQLIQDAEVLIRTRIKDLDARVTDLTYSSLVDIVIRSAVCRVLRNPLGIRQESEGDRSLQLDSRVGTGFLTILDSEWAYLGGSESGAYTVNPNAWRMQQGPQPFGWLPDGRPLRWVYLT